MRWAKPETRKRYYDYMTAWHPRFAIWPEHLDDGSWVWLEWVEVKGVPHTDAYGDSYWSFSKRLKGSK